MKSLTPTLLKLITSSFCLIEPLTASTVAPRVIPTDLNIWNIYVDMVLATNDHVDEVRHVVDEALRCCGHHVSLSHGLWEKARQFELSQEEVEQSRVSELYLGEIGVPTEELEAVWAEYSHWSVEPVTKRMTESRRVLRTLQPFEEDLRKECSLAVFDEYLSANTHISAIKRRQNLLERIIDTFPDSERHWALYIELLISRYDSSDEYMRVVCAVVEQANRLFPANSSFWVHRIQLINYSIRNTNDERLLEAFTHVFQSAFSVKFSSSREYKGVYMAAMLFYRMRLTENEFSQENYTAVCEICTYAQEFFLTNYPGDLSSLAEILLFSAQFMASGDLARSRELFECLVTSDMRGNFRYWNCYYVMESSHGDVSSQRRVLKRAMACVKDQTQLISDMYMGFERVHGDYNSYWLAVRRITEKNRKRNNPYLKDSFVSRKFSNNDKLVGEDGSKNSNYSKKIDNSGKMARKEGPKLSNYSEKINSSDIISGKLSRKVQKPCAQFEINSPAKRVCIEEGKEQRTVFLSNLPFTVKATEIREIFTKAGNVVDVRIIGDDGHGSHRGYAYIEFESEEGVVKALQLDRTLIGTRPMFVSKYGSRGFRYSTDLDKTKLFIRNLPAQMDSSGLEEFLTKAGIVEVKDVRLVTRKNGKSKRVAYVDFAEVFSAHEALSVLDGYNIEGCVIAAAFSNPPPKQPKDDLPMMIPKRAQGRQKTKIDFAPRSIRKGKAGDG